MDRTKRCNGCFDGLTEGFWPTLQRLAASPKQAGADIGVLLLSGGELVARYGASEVKKRLGLVVVATADQRLQDEVNDIIRRDKVGELLEMAANCPRHGPAK